MIIYRQNQILRARGKQGNMDWVKYDAYFVINWEGDDVSRILQYIHPCHLWLAEHSFTSKYFHAWYKEVSDNIRPPNENKNNQDKCNYSYPCFKMICFMSFAFNSTRYTYSHYQTQIAKSAIEVCNVI